MMGQTITPKKKEILMVGLDGAGKTTLLNKLPLDNDIITPPIIGYTLEITTFLILLWYVFGYDNGQ